MLAPISSATRHGGSSFSVLGAYITRRGGKRSGKTPIEETDIVLSPALRSWGITTPEEAAQMMRVTASQCVRTKDPVYHFQIAWPPDEKPTDEQWKQAAVNALEALNLETHEYVLAAHRDTESFHLHVMVNRVNPETFVSQSIFQDMLKLDKAMREIEADQGWSESKGLYRWDGATKSAIRRTREEMDADRDNTAPRSKAASKLESFQDRESLERFVQGPPARAVKEYLDGSQVSWQGLHTVLAKHGLALNKGVKGGFTVSALDGHIHVKASDVLRSHFAGKEKRERVLKALGEWQEPAQANAVHISRSRNQNVGGARVYDSDKRAQQAEIRQHERAALRAEYMTYRNKGRKATGHITEQAHKQRQAIWNEVRDKRVDIRNSSMTRAEKRAALSTLTAQGIIARRTVTTNAAAERMIVQPDTYQMWVENKAGTGHKAALAQMRAWAYSNSRRAARIRKIIAEQQDAAHFLSPLSEETPEWRQTQHDKLLQARQNHMLAETLKATRWRVHVPSGDVSYSLNGELAIVDRGKAISVLTNEESAIVLGLELAIAKYGKVLSVEGSRVWQDKVARIAAKQHISVSFTSPEMQQTQLEEKRKENPAEYMATRLYDLAELLHHRPNTPLNLTSRESARVVLVALYGEQGADEVLDTLDEGLAQGTARTIEIRGIATIKASRQQGSDNTRFTLSPLPDKSGELQQVVSNAADAARKSAGIGYAERYKRTQSTQKGVER